MSDRAPTILAGNWKMNGTRASISELTAMAMGRKDISNVEKLKMVVCVPATLLSQASDALASADIATGGQNCHTATSGAHTGDISAEMIHDAGAQYVILGHSERRADHHETDGLVRAKAETAISANLVPIICVGETLAERKNGLAQTVVEQQLSGSVPEASLGSNLVIAYEPVWAIGTGEVPSIEDIADIHKAIRDWLIKHYGEQGVAISILYGGSLKPANASEILTVPNVNGGLIGGASLKSSDFLAIVEAAAAQITA